MARSYFFLTLWHVLNQGSLWTLVFHRHGTQISNRSKKPASHCGGLRATGSLAGRRLSSGNRLLACQILIAKWRGLTSYGSVSKLYFLQTSFTRGDMTEFSNRTKRFMT